MRALKRAAYGLIILAVFYLIFYLLTQLLPPKPTPKVASAVDNIVLFEQPDAGRQPIIEALDNSASSIKVEVYLLSDNEIISALVRAHSKGINVQVILERHPFGASALNPKTKTYLEQQNIPVHWSDPDFALTHEKSIIVDDNKLFVLGQNLTASSFTKNREYDIIDVDKNDVKEARAIFEADWNDTPFTPTDSHLLVSPINSRAGITHLIQKATKEIDIEIEVISDPGIVNLLIEKSKTVKVKLLAPTINQIKSNKDSLVALSKSDIEVHTISSPYIHAKLIVVDNSLAYTGSINFSAQSMDRNRELGIIFSQSDLIKYVHYHFETDWQKSIPF